MADFDEDYKPLLDDPDEEEDRPISLQPPMNKAEAEQSISRAKGAFFQKKKHENILRWELYIQRERRAYVPLGFKTFDEFAEATYHIKKAYAHQLANASQTEQSLSAIADYAPMREYALRILGKVAADKREEVYNAACEASDSKQPTAAAITEAGRKLGYIPEKKNGSKSKSIVKMSCVIRVSSAYDHSSQAAAQAASLPSVDGLVHSGVRHARVAGHSCL